MNNIDGSVRFYYVTEEGCEAKIGDEKNPSDIFKCERRGSRASEERRGKYNSLISHPFHQIERLKEGQRW